MALQPQEKSVWASMNDSGFFPFNLMIDHSHNFAPKWGLCFPVSYTVRLHKCLPDVERASNLHRLKQRRVQRFFVGLLQLCMGTAIRYM